MRIHESAVPDIIKVPLELESDGNFLFRGDQCGLARHALPMPGVENPRIRESAATIYLFALEYEFFDVYSVYNYRIAINTSILNHVCQKPVTLPFAFDFSQPFGAVHEGSVVVRVHEVI